MSYKIRNNIAIMSVFWLMFTNVSEVLANKIFIYNFIKTGHVMFFVSPTEYGERWIICS